MTETVTRLRQCSESPVEAARRLEGEARDLATSAASALITDLILIAGRCGELSTLESLPPGLRDLLRRLGDDIAAKVEQAQAINARAS